MDIGANILRDKFIENPSQIDLNRWFTFHNTQVERYKRLIDYYKGEQDILDRTSIITGNANNKTVTNFCKLITNTMTGYFISIPVEYSSGDEKQLELVKKLYKDNNGTDEDYEISKKASIYGNSFEVLYYNANGEVKFDEFTPESCFIIYSDDFIGEVPIAAINYKKIVSAELNKEKWIIDYYTKDNVTRMITDNALNILSSETNKHFFKDIPVIELKNNNERIGDFEQVLTLQDTYNVLMSDRANNVTNVVNALLMLRNYRVPATEEGLIAVKKMKEMGIINVDDDGDAKFLTCNLDATASKEIADSIARDIHKVSNCPDMTDESFSSNSSGVAMKYKLWGAEQEVSAKQRKFTTFLNKRYKLITESPKQYILNDLDYKFTENIPVNVSEQVKTVRELYGTISNETYYELLEPLGVTKDEEMGRVEEQEKSDVLGV